MAIYPSGSIISNRFEVVQGPGEKPSLAGGMGLVYLCVDHAEDGKPIALKTFRSELLSDRAARDRFLREGTTWVELGKHPHIVHCYKVFKADVGSEVFFALELVAAAEGKKDASLRSWLIPNEPLPLEQALLFALHICRAMVHATTKIPGLVHRDLKPENILIGRDGRARVTDFGLASAAQNLNSDWQRDEDKSSSHIRTQLTHGIAGTPLYMAPEQWKGEPLDERADIYAFGCIVYEMLCSSFVVNGKSIEEIKDAHCQGRLREIPTEIKGLLSNLLQRCLALNSGDRYPGWMELENEVAEVYYAILGEKTPELNEEVKDTRADQIAAGWSHNAIGLSYKDIGKFEVARNYFEKVRTIAQKENERELEGVALGNIGIAHARLGNFYQAIKIYKQSLIILREIGDRQREGECLGSLGFAYLQLGDPQKAIELYKKWLVIVREFDDRKGEGQALANVGFGYAALGDCRLAIEYYKQSLTIACEIGDRRSESQALGGLGNVCFQLGDFYKAIEYYEQYLTIACEIGDRLNEGQALAGLGNAYIQLRNPRKAIRYYERNLIIVREISDRDGEGRALGNLGNAYDDLGYPNQAIEFYKQSLAILHEIGDIMGAAQTSYNLAFILKKEESSDALRHAEYALQVFTQVGHKQYSAQVKALINGIRR